MGILGALLQWVLERFFGRPPAAKIEDIAASNAHAQDDATLKGEALDQVQKADAARGDADSNVVRILAKGGDVNAALKSKFPDEFRD